MTIPWESNVERGWIWNMTSKRLSEVGDGVGGGNGGDVMAPDFPLARLDAFGGTS